MFESRGTEAGDDRRCAGLLRGARVTGAREVHVDAGDGTRFGVLVAEPAAPATAGLLFVPAMGVTARHYGEFARALAAQGVLVAVHELRGGGSSSVRASRRSDWGYAELLDRDLPASLAALRREFPSVAWFAGGHSLGAQLAALHAARCPAELRGMVIVASGSPYWRAFPHWQRPLVRLVFAWFRGLSALLGYFPGRRVGFAGTEARSVIRDWTRSGQHGNYRPDRVAADLEAALAAFPGLVFALRNAHDRFVPRASLDWLLGKLGAARVTRLELATSDYGSGRADHFSWMKDPGPVAERLAAWIAEGNARP